MSPAIYHTALRPEIQRLDLPRLATSSARFLILSGPVPVLPLAALDEGDMVSVQVHGQPILLCQVEGQFYALNDRCSHASQALSRGRLKGFELRCPLHGARFDVRTGAALSAPATAGIATYPVLIEGGKVCVVAPER